MPMIFLSEILNRESRRHSISSRRIFTAFEKKTYEGAGLPLSS